MAKPKSNKTKPSIPAAVGKTYVGIVLDASGSMSFGKSETISSFNEQLQTIQNGAKQIQGETLVSFLSFSNEATILANNAPVGDVKPISNETYQPNGGTALYDTVWQAIDMIEANEGSREADSAILMVIFTDGDENASRKISGSQLSSRIETLEATGRWTFTLVGPKESISVMADTMKMKSGNVRGYDVNSIQEKSLVGAAMSASTMSYFSSRSEGKLQVEDFYGPEGAPKDADPVTLQPGIAQPGTPRDLFQAQPIPSLPAMPTTPQPIQMAPAQPMNGGGLNLRPFPGTAIPGPSIPGVPNQNKTFDFFKGRKTD
jgi:uncharacterized protein YegL